MKSRKDSEGSNPLSEARSDESNDRYAALDKKLAEVKAALERITVAIKEMIGR